MKSIRFNHLPSNKLITVEQFFCNQDTIQQSLRMCLKFFFHKHLYFNECICLFEACMEVCDLVQYILKWKHPATTFDITIPAYTMSIIQMLWQDKIGCYR